METGQHRPNAKWFRDMLLGNFMSHSLMLSEIGRTLREKDANGRLRRLIHTEKRLSRNLLSDRFDDQAFYAAWFGRIGRHLGADDGKGVVLAIDYTDIRKNGAKKPPSKEQVRKGLRRPDEKMPMQFISWCRDGSTKKVGARYPIAQFEASRSNGVRAPVLYHVFSKREPGYLSEPKVFMDCMDRVAPHIGKQAWWALDRGFQNMQYFDHMDRLGVRWATRVKIGAKVKNPQTLFLADGTKTDVGTAAVAVPLTTKVTQGSGRAHRT